MNGWNKPWRWMVAAAGAVCLAGCGKDPGAMSIDEIVERLRRAGITCSARAIVVEERGDGVLGAYEIRGPGVDVSVQVVPDPAKLQADLATWKRWTEDTVLKEGRHPWFLFYARAPYLFTVRDPHNLDLMTDALMEILPGGTVLRWDRG